MQLKRCTKTDRRWNKTAVLCSSPVCWATIFPRTARKWTADSSERLHRNRLEMVICCEPSILGSFLWCCHLRCRGRFLGHQGYIRIHQWVGDCDIPYEWLSTLPRNQSETIWAFAIRPTQTLQVLGNGDWCCWESMSYQLVKVMMVDGSSGGIITITIIIIIITTCECSW